MTHPSSPSTFSSARDVSQPSPGQRKLNAPLLAVSLGVLLAVAVAFYLGHSYQVRRLAFTYMQRAEEYAAKSNWQQATDYMYRYSQHRPDDRAALIRLARWYDRITNGRSTARAIDLYYRALGVAEGWKRRSCVADWRN